MATINPEATWLFKTISSKEATINAFRDRALLDPRLYGGAMAAALIAPLFLSNDERGYFQTSMITTPLIVAGSMVARPLFQAMRTEGNHLKEFAKDAPAMYGFAGKSTVGADLVSGAVSNIYAMDQAWQDGRITEAELQRAQMSFYASGKKPIFNLQQEQNSVLAQLKAFEDKPAKTRLLSNAFHRTGMESMSAVEIANNVPSEIAPIISYQEMLNQFSAHKTDPEWLKSMQFRLQQAAGSHDMGGTGVFNHTTLHEEIMPQYHAWVDDFGDVGAGQAMLRKHYPQYAAEVDALVGDSAAMTAGKLRLQDIQIATLPEGNQPFGKILGLRILGEEGKPWMKPLPLPIRQADGGVYLGANWGNRGIAGVIGTHQGNIDPTTYAIRGLRNGRSPVRKQLESVMYVSGRDMSVDAGRTLYESDGVAQATLAQMAVGQNVVVMGNLPGAFPANEGGDGSWDSLRPKNKVAEIRYQNTQFGNIKVTGGTDIGKMETAAAALLDPGGLPSANKESSVMKGENKSWMLELPKEEYTRMGHPMGSRTGAFSSSTASLKPKMGVRTTQVTAQQRSMFGDLPEWSEFGEDLDAFVKDKVGEMPALDLPAWKAPEWSSLTALEEHIKSQPQMVMPSRAAAPVVKRSGMGSLGEAFQHAHANDLLADAGYQADVLLAEKVFGQKHAKWSRRALQLRNEEVQANKEAMLASKAAVSAQRRAMTAERSAAVVARRTEAALHVFNVAGIERHIIGHIALDQNITQAAAKQIYDKFAPALTSQKSYEAIRTSTAYLGDGSWALAGDAIPGAVITERKAYSVSEPALSMEVNEKGWFGPHDAIGYENGVPRFAGGDQNFIENVQFNSATGVHTFDIKEVRGIGASKLQGLKKMTVVNGITMEGIGDSVDVLNSYHGALGDGVAIPRNEIQGISMFIHKSDEAGNPLQAIHDLTGDFFRRVQDAEGYKGKGTWISKSPFVQSAREELATYGMHYNDELGILSEPAGEMLQLAGGKAQGRAIASVQVIGGMFNKATEGLKDGSFVGDRAMMSAVDWLRQNPEKRIDDFMVQFALPESVQPSDHMNANHASKVKVSRDVFEQLNMQGEYDIAQDLEQRLVTDGDTAMTRKFMEYVDPSVKQNYAAPLEGNVISSVDAIGTSELDLGTAAGRTFMSADGSTRLPTIFDDQHPLTHGNYSVQLGDGSYMPMLGRDAYGGKANHYGVAGFSANKWEDEARDVLFADKRARAGRTSWSEVGKLRDTYVEKVRSSSGFGKEGFLVADRVDPLGAEGRITARSSTLERFTGGSVNPNEVAVGDSYKHLFDEDTWARMVKGERVEGTVLRQPINAVIPTMIRYDPQFDGSRQIGADPLLLLKNRGDADGDRISIHVAKSDKAKQRIREANGYQRNSVGEWVMGAGNTNEHKMHEWAAFFEGTELNYRTSTKKSDAISPFELLTKFYKTDAERTAALAARTAAADVGMLSNTFEQVQGALAHSKIIKAPMEKLVLHRFFYDVIREASIAAQKAKQGNVNAYDLTRLMAWNSSIMESLKNKDGGKFADLMTEGAANFGKEIDITDEHRKFMGWAAGYQGADGKGKVNAYLEYARHERQKLIDTANSFDPARAAIISRMNMSDTRAAEYAGDAVSDLGNEFPWMQAESRRGGAVDAMADTLGGINAGTASTAAHEASRGAVEGETVGRTAANYARKVQRAAEGTADHTMGSIRKVLAAAKGHGAGRTLGIGLAIAGGAGLLFGSIHSPRENSALAPPSSPEVNGNAYRPEEQLSGDDMIPGEPEVGAMAPTGGPRTVRPANRGVRTAVVAPINHSTDLEVKMRSEDSGRAAEMAKHMAAMSASGDSHVTVNYRDGNRLNSLRTKQKIRDTLHKD